MRSENYQNCCVLYCIYPICAQSYAHSCEQFLGPVHTGDRVKSRQGRKSTFNFVAVDIVAKAVLFDSTAYAPWSDPIV